jgi:hypothetical protein
MAKVKVQLIDNTKPGRDAFEIESKDNEANAFFELTRGYFYLLMLINDDVLDELQDDLKLADGIQNYFDLTEEQKKAIYDEMAKKNITLQNTNISATHHNDSITWVPHSPNMVAFYVPFGMFKQNDKMKLVATSYSDEDVTFVLNKMPVFDANVYNDGAELPRSVGFTLIESSNINNYEGFRNVNLVTQAVMHDIEKKEMKLNGYDVDNKVNNTRLIMYVVVSSILIFMLILSNVSLLKKC